ncbi:hypothetical protein CDAR_596581 [Caerostris darwini]|uniref:Uncharacterized protein n=1 Tax=Caerostris darwini TaxID=1538125 RepID=A0AAV4WCB8_9ARAC|nr:hypothetical protein CDAR_596581 [Caerostris darwini]
MSKKKKKGEESSANSRIMTLEIFSALIILYFDSFSMSHNFMNERFSTVKYYLLPIIPLKGPNCGTLEQSEALINNTTPSNTSLTAKSHGRTWKKSTSLLPKHCFGKYRLK